MHVPHCLQVSARGIFGRGREIRLDASLGGAGSLRGLLEGSRVLEDVYSADMVVEAKTRDGLLPVSASKYLLVQNGVDTAISTHWVSTINHSSQVPPPTQIVQNSLWLLS